MENSINKDALTPKMYVPTNALAHWDELDDEQKIRMEVFHPDELPQIADKIYFFSNSYWWEV